MVSIRDDRVRRLSATVPRARRNCQSAYRRNEDNHWASGSIVDCSHGLFHNRSFRESAHPSCDFEIPFDFWEIKRSSNKSTENQREVPEVSPILLSPKHPFDFF